MRLSFALIAFIDIGSWENIEESRTCSVEEMQAKSTPVFKYPFTVLTVILLRFGMVYRTHASNFPPVIFFPLEGAPVWLA